MLLFVMVWGKEMAAPRYNLLYYLRGISARVAGGISVHVLLKTGADKRTRCEIGEKVILCFPLL